MQVFLISLYVKAQMKMTNDQSCTHSWKFVLTPLNSCENVKENYASLHQVSCNIKKRESTRSAGTFLPLPHHHPQPSPQTENKIKYVEFYKARQGKVLREAKSFISHLRKIMRGCRCRCNHWGHSVAKLELKKVIKFNFLSKNLSLSWSDQTR